MKELDYQKTCQGYSKGRFVCCLLLGLLTGLLLSTNEIPGRLFHYHQRNTYNYRKNYLSNILTEYIFKNIDHKSDHQIKVSNSPDNLNKESTESLRRNRYTNTDDNKTNLTLSLDPPLKVHIDINHSRKLYNKIRILCYINTHPGNYYKKAIHVHNTWARRCTKHLFISTKPDPVLPIAVLKLPYPEVRMHLWSKIRAALRYIYQFRDDFDYF
ncbi:unnamed protein product [Heterobilharzia americana]|nr:unnamed protein product [Heterobilharzia americana]